LAWGMKYLLMKVCQMEKVSKKWREKICKNTFLDGVDGGHVAVC